MKFFRVFRWLGKFVFGRRNAPGIQLIEVLDLISDRQNQYIDAETEQRKAEIQKEITLLRALQSNFQHYANSRSAETMRTFFVVSFGVLLIADTTFSIWNALFGTNYNLTFNQELMQIYMIVIPAIAVGTVVEKIFK